MTRVFAIQLNRDHTLIFSLKTEKSRGKCIKEKKNRESILGSTLSFVFKVTIHTAHMHQLLRTFFYFTEIHRSILFVIESKLEGNLNV